MMSSDSAYRSARVAAEVSRGLAEAARWERSDRAWALGARAWALEEPLAAVEAARFRDLQRIYAALDDSRSPHEQLARRARALEAALFRDRMRCPAAFPLYMTRGRAFWKRCAQS